MLSPSVFAISRIILFFVATYYIFKALQAIDFSKIFMKNSSEHIRLIIIMLSVIIAYLFVDAIVSLFENLNILI